MNCPVQSNCSCLCTVHAVLSISFEVDVPTGKVGGSLLFEWWRRELPRGGLGACPPQKILKFRCLEMLFSTFSRQYLGLKEQSKLCSINHILCLLQLFFSSKSQSLALRKEWNDKSSNADSKNTFNVLSSCCPFEKTCSAMSALVFFGADAILANAKAWDLVLWKCPRRSTTLRSHSICFNFLYFHRKVNTFKTPEMCLYLD